MNRRMLLQATASMAVLGLAPAFASTGSCVLLAGLPTDDAFVLGTGIRRCLQLRADAAAYAALVQTLRRSAGLDLLALVDARHALLLEQATRDADLALLARVPVNPTHAEDAGRMLVQGEVTQLPGHPSGALVALHMKSRVES